MSDNLSFKNLWRNFSDIDLKTKGFYFSRPKNNPTANYIQSLIILNESHLTGRITINGCSYQYNKNWSELIEIVGPIDL